MKSGESRSFAKGDSCRIPRACGGEWENSHKERKKHNEHNEHKERNEMRNFIRPYFEHWYVAPLCHLVMCFIPYWPWSGTSFLIVLAVTYIGCIAAVVYQFAHRWWLKATLSLLVVVSAAAWFVALGVLGANR